MKYLFFFGLFLLLQPAHAAILIEEGGNPVPPAETTSVVSTKTAPNSYEMRKIRRAAVGLTGGGGLGMGGATLEMAFVPEIGLIAGFGGGTGYRTFMGQGRYYLGSGALAPYLAAGLTHWYSSESEQAGMDNVTPGFLKEKLLSEEEKQTGRFSKTMLYPSLGLQYMQLTGTLAGWASSIDLLVLFDFDRFVAVPTGALNIQYYF